MISWSSATRSTPSSSTPGTNTCRFATLGAEIGARTVTVTSTSKAFNLAGLRWAILHAGPDEFHDALAGLPKHYLGAPNLLAVEATDAAWTDGDDWLTAVRGVLDDNRRSLAALLARHLPGVVYHEPQATYLAWLDCRGLGLGDDPAQTFRERGVELAPGPRFGCDRRRIRPTQLRHQPDRPGSDRRAHGRGLRCVVTGGYGMRPSAGIVPRRPAWKSSNAWTSSSLVFITNGPYAATGSPIGRPPNR